MNSFLEIVSQQDMDELLDSIMNFHDSMTKEIHIINRGCVLPNHSMNMAHRFDLDMLIQSQCPPYAIELVFIDVYQFGFTDSRDYFNATGKVEEQLSPVEKVTIKMQFDRSLNISCKRLFYRIREKWLGHKAFLTSEVPSPDTEKALDLGDNWRQCYHCLNTWEVSPEKLFSVCPGCGRLTELQKKDQDVSIR